MTMQSKSIEGTELQIVANDSGTITLETTSGYFAIKDVAIEHFKRLLAIQSEFADQVTSLKPTIKYYRESGCFVASYPSTTTVVFYATVEPSKEPVFIVKVLQQSLPSFTKERRKDSIPLGWNMKPF